MTISTETDATDERENEISKEEDSDIYIVGMTKPTQVEYESNEPLELGLDLVLQYDDHQEALGFVEQTYTSTQLFAREYIYNIEDAKASARAARHNKHDYSHHGYIRIV